MDEAKQIFFLLAEDEIQALYEKSLTEEGFHVRWFTHPEKLIEAGAHESVPLVLIDLEVLDLSSDNLLEELRTVFSQSELIALSSSDAAQTTIQCLRNGFSDLLLKPATPEELLWSVHRSYDRTQLFKKMPQSEAALFQVVSQIGGSTTPILIYFYFTHYLQVLFGAEGVAWLRCAPVEDAEVEIVFYTPRGIPSNEIMRQIPRDVFRDRSRAERIYSRKEKKTTTRKLVLLGKEAGGSAVFAWGIQKTMSLRHRERARLLFQHSLNALFHLTRLERARKETFIDDLTGLYNARYLKFALSTILQRARRLQLPFALLFIDIDKFKTVNDRNGHLIGSEFLIAIGRTVKKTVRNIDPVFRYGGDEFIVILQDSDLTGSAEIAERIRKAIERRVFLIQGQRLQTTVSIGIACYPAHATDKEDLLRLADEAMYAAKRNERNAVYLAKATKSVAEAGSEPAKGASSA